MKRKKVVSTAKSITYHSQVVTEYNKIKPLPVGYVLKVTDDWCAAFVSVVYNKLKYKDILECSVPRMIELAKKKKIWHERSFKNPDIGDIIVYDWDGNADGDHVGIITYKYGGLITTREGNVYNNFGERHIYMDDSRIIGYITPPFEDEAAPVQEVKYKTIDDIVNSIIKGEFGNGEDRKQNLYNYFQKLVNDKLGGK